MLDYRVSTFMAVIEEGTLRKASRRLGITQPAVSQHLKSLEAEYGLPLFDHKGRRLVVNDAGRMLYAAAEHSAALFGRFRRESVALHGGKRHYVMGATLTIGEFILPYYLGAYRDENPGLELTIRIENTVSVLALLDRGDIDLALVEGPFDRTRYQCRLFVEDEMIFIGDHRTVGPRVHEITPELLARTRLILREQGSGTRYYWEEYCARRGIQLPPSSVTMEVGSLSAIKSLAEAGVGCSVMSRRAVAKELLMGTLATRPFSTGPLMREMFFVFREESPMAFIDDFIAFVRHREEPTATLS